MTTTVLKAEVQLRINSPALVYTSGTLQAKQVLQYSVDALGLDLDLTNIISVLNSMSSAIVAGTPTKDITAISAASVNLGVTSKGGGRYNPLKGYGKFKYEGVATTVFTLSPSVSGRSVRLLSLSTSNGTGISGTLTKDGVTLYDTMLLDGSLNLTSSTFNVNTDSNSTTPYVKGSEPLISEPNGSIVFETHAATSGGLEVQWFWDEGVFV